MTDEDVTDEHVNPEAPLPVTIDAEWYPPIMRRMWKASELQDALSNLGWSPTVIDPNVRHLCADCNGVDIELCDGCDDEGQVDLILRKNHRWVSPDGTTGLRLPKDGSRVVSPYLAACVVAAIGLAE